MLGNLPLTFLTNMCTNLNLTDMETCYKTTRINIFKQINIEQNGFGFESDITATAAHIRNIRIYEVDIPYSDRTYEEGKRITWRDGIAAIWYIIKYRISR